MLHYLVDIIEKKFPELLSFSEELPHIDKAAKISTETIQKTIYQIEVNLKNVQTDINNCKSLPKDNDDKFEEVMNVSFFIITAILLCSILIIAFLKLQVSPPLAHPENLKYKKLVCFLNKFSMRKKKSCH